MFRYYGYATKTSSPWSVNDHCLSHCNTCTMFMKHATYRKLLWIWIVLTRRAFWDQWVPKCDVIKFSFSHTPNFTWIGSSGHKVWPHEYLISPHWKQCKLAWFITVRNQGNLHWFQWGYLGIHAAISRAPMNRFPPNLDCGGIHPALPIYGIQNAEIRGKNWRHHFGTLLPANISFLSTTTKRNVLDWSNHTFLDRF